MSTTSLRRQYYFSARQPQSRPGWSCLSDELTQDSSTVRYYDQSPPLQQLKARIELERDAMVAEYAGLQREPVSFARIYDGYQGDQEQLGAEGTEVSQSPLPALPLHTKVVVSERSTA